MKLSWTPDFFFLYKQLPIVRFVAFDELYNRHYIRKTPRYVHTEDTKKFTVN